MGKRLRIPLLMALAAAPIAVGVLVRAGAPDMPQGGDLGQALLECRGGVQTLAAAGSEASRECMMEVSRTAVQEGRMVELQEAFDRDIETIPGMQNLCHDIGHYTGREAYRPGESILEVMQEARESCIFGFGHGVLDGIAASDPSEEVLRETAFACSQLQGVAVGLCVDGLGHLAWSATGSLEDAVAVCAHLPEHVYRALCGEGIIMQIYTPAGFLPSADVREAPGELEELCSAWPGPADIRAGCYTGAGYVYMQEVSRAYFQWRLNPDDSEGTAEFLDEEMRRVVELCGRHGDPEGALLCEKGAYYQIPATADEIEPGLRERMCMRLDSSMREECIEYFPYFG